jgi:hypothetical protein
VKGVVKVAIGPWSFASLVGEIENAEKVTARGWIISKPGVQLHDDSKDAKAVLAVKLMIRIAVWRVFLS